MGRDDAKTVAGLQGGTAPARAFADFMKVAVAKRPVEQFETQVTLPEFQLEPDDEVFFGQPDDGSLVGPDGLPAETAEDPVGELIDRTDPQAAAPAPAPPRIAPPPPAVAPARQPARTSLGSDFLSGVDQKPARRP